MKNAPDVVERIIDGAEMVLELVLFAMAVYAARRGDFSVSAAAVGLACYFKIGRKCK